ncbi:metallophosphoesterase [Devosia algicola]|uniref:Metallophosphoesterase n=1 Tax=Devosia algicola TaxID=3026418 RepID=A0ABY7YT11_9HYPH|nr:metallophosphoesterase [Devosia algicola]WDR04104.1 metallophosphoesterase [Devosia algicola]
MSEPNTNGGRISKGKGSDGSAFPFIRRLDDIAVISCSSAVPTRPLLATGRFDDEQASRLARLLTETGKAGLFRVVMIHHPPNPELQHPSFGLKGHKLFRKIIAEHGAELILHGHTHRSSIHSISGLKHEVPVIGVAAASAAQGSGLDDPARYNLFRIEKSGNGWTCTMREYGYQRLGTDIVMRLQMRIY